MKSGEVFDGRRYRSALIELGTLGADLDRRLSESGQRSTKEKQEARARADQARSRAAEATAAAEEVYSSAVVACRQVGYHGLPVPSQPPCIGELDQERQRLQQALGGLQQAASMLQSHNDAADAAKRRRAADEERRRRESELAEQEACRAAAVNRAQRQERLILLPVLALLSLATPIAAALEPLLAGPMILVGTVSATSTFAMAGSWTMRRWYVRQHPTHHPIQIPAASRWRLIIAAGIATTAALWFLAGPALFLPIGMFGLAFVLAQSA